MKLERLDIRVLSGLEEPFTLHFEPDAVNFITGPNASGKSSIIRAVRALLYPDQSSEFCHIRARWRIGDRVLDCERHGTAVTWLDGANPAPPPRLPGTENTGAYLISSEDLNQFGNTESHIAGEIRTMLAGGYDLDAVLAVPPLAAPPKPQKLARGYSELRREIGEKEEEYARLNDELATLARLHHELETTTDSAARLRACEDAIALADAIARRNAIENTLIEEFPGGMDRLRGDELTRIDQIEARLEERRKEKALTRAALERAEKKLEETGAVDPHQIEALQSSLSDMRDELAELERAIAEHESALEQARHDRETTSQRLGAEKPELDRKLDQQSLEQLERLVERVMGHREKIRTLTAELARIHVPTNVAGDSPERLHQARQALKDWLELARLSPLEGVLWGGLGGSAILAAWRVLGPQEIEIVPELVLLIALAAGIPLFMLVRFVDRLRTLRRARDDFDATGVEAPLGWTESEVEARMVRLDQEMEASTHNSVRQARAGEVRQRLNEERAGLEMARDKLADHAGQLGLSPEQRIETGFLLWCRHLHDWQQAERAVAHHERSLAETRRRHAKLAAAAAEMLARHGFEEFGEPSSRSLSSLIHQLGPRIRANAELHNEIRAARQRLEELDADIEQLRAQHAQVYNQAGLDSDDRETMVRRIEQFEDWRSLEQQRRDHSMEVNRLEQRLRPDRELLEQASEQQHEALEKLREELGEQAARRDELNRRIATINTRHEEVVKRRELESLSGELEQLRQSLSEALDAQLLAGAGRLLVEDVRRAHQADNEPAALSRAAGWFE
ncbi:MAG: AAA family ATPase, partial [Wenzhouxiangella sp.]